MQDAVKLSQPGDPGRFEMPNWDPVSQKKVRDALIVQAATVPDTRRMFGARDQVDAVRHLIGTATDWGGNPEKDALYVTILPSKNNGITIYRLNEGCAHRWRLVNQRLQRRRLFPEKPVCRLHTQQHHAVKGADGLATIQFGGCDAKAANCLPIAPGWNYWIRHYRPRAEILNGTWKIAEAEPVN